MNWEKILGWQLFDKVKEYISARKMTVSALVRLAVEQYLEGRQL